jgi:hypothetical protein
MDSYRPLYPHSGASSGRPEPAVAYSSYPIQVYEDTHSRGYYEHGSHHGYSEAWGFQSQYTSQPFTDWNRTGVRPDETTASSSNVHSLEALSSPGAYSHSSWGHSTHGIDEECMSPTSEAGRGGSHSSQYVRAIDLPALSLANMHSSKKFACDFEMDSKVKCDAAFARKADRDRHRACVHQKENNRTHPCNEPGCNRNGPNGFTRKDHLTEHARNFHQKAIPKRSKASKKGGLA